MQDSFTRLSIPYLAKFSSGSHGRIVFSAIHFNILSNIQANN